MPDKGGVGGFRRQRLLLTALLFVGYSGYYLGRVTVPVALPLIGEAFDYSNTQTGLILSVYFAVYAASKLLNGFLGDRVGGKAMFFVGVFGSALMNAVFGFGQELLFFVVIWGSTPTSRPWAGWPSCPSWPAGIPAGRAAG